MKIFIFLIVIGFLPPFSTSMADKIGLPTQKDQMSSIVSKSNPSGRVFNIGGHNISILGRITFEDEDRSSYGFNSGISAATTDGRRIWFGTMDDCGEGCTAPNAIGFFDVETRKFGIFRHPDLKESGVIGIEVSDHRIKLVTDIVSECLESEGCSDNRRLLTFDAESLEASDGGKSLTNAQRTAIAKLGATRFMTEEFERETNQRDESFDTQKPMEKECVLVAANSIGGFSSCEFSSNNLGAGSSTSNKEVNGKSKKVEKHHGSGDLLKIEGLWSNAKTKTTNEDQNYVCDSRGMFKVLLSISAGSTLLSRHALPPGRTIDPRPDFSLSGMQPELSKKLEHSYINLKPGTKLTAKGPSIRASIEVLEVKTTDLTCSGKLLKSGPAFESVKVLMKIWKMPTADKI